MHDLQRVVRDLQESLSLDKHPVALLLGAGCPCSVRVTGAAGADEPLIPDIAGLTLRVKTALAGDTSFGVLVRQFKTDGKPDFNIEDLLSRVRNLQQIVGKGDARGLDASALDELEKQLCQQIVDVVRKELPNSETPYHHLADWIGGVSRTWPVELFTTNYDRLIEQALEERNLPFFDGFVGTRHPFFDLHAIEEDTLPARWTRLWKLHGCLSWCLRPGGKVVRSQAGTTSAEGLLIHPSEFKYDQSRRMPYLAMMDRLRAFLRRPSALLVTLGYGYGDEHLNEVLLQGLRGNPNAAAFGLLYKTLSEESAAATLAPRVPLNLTLMARDQACVRAEIGDWADLSAGPDVKAVTNDLGDFSEFAKFVKGFVPTRGS